MLKEGPHPLLTEVWKTPWNHRPNSHPSLNPAHLLCPCDLLLTSLVLRGKKGSLRHSQNCLRSSEPPSDTLFPSALVIFVECLPASGTYLLVYEWIPPQLALLPAQHHPISSLGFPPTAGLGHLLSVQRQQPKHRGQLEIFRSVDPTAAKLGESRMWELVRDWRGHQPLLGPRFLCPTCDCGDDPCP